MRITAVVDGNFMRVSWLVAKKKPRLAAEGGREPGRVLYCWSEVLAAG
jgi:hypothetical protein